MQHYGYVLWPDSALYRCGVLVIRRTKGGFLVVSEKGRRLSKVLRTMRQAKKRLAMVEYFKKHKR